MLINNLNQIDPDPTTLAAKAAADAKKAAYQAENKRLTDASILADSASIKTATPGSEWDTQGNYVGSNQSENPNPYSVASTTGAGANTGATPPIVAPPPPSPNPYNVQQVDMARAYFRQTQGREPTFQEVMQLVTSAPPTKQATPTPGFTMPNMPAPVQSPTGYGAYRKQMKVDPTIGGFNAWNQAQKAQNDVANPVATGYGAYKDATLADPTMGFGGYKAWEQQQEAKNTVSMPPLPALLSNLINQQYGTYASQYNANPTRIQPQMDQYVRDIMSQYYGKQGQGGSPFVAPADTTNWQGAWDTSQANSQQQAAVAAANQARQAQQQALMAQANQTQQVDEFGNAIPGYATGGIVGKAGPEVIRVGERGPEAVVPLAGGPRPSGLGNLSPQILQLVDNAFRQQQVPAIRLPQVPIGAGRLGVVPPLLGGAALQQNPGSALKEQLLKKLLLSNSLG